MFGEGRRNIVLFVEDFDEVQRFAGHEVLSEGWIGHRARSSRREALGGGRGGVHGAGFDVWWRPEAGMSRRCERENKSKNLHGGGGDDFGLRPACSVDCELGSRPFSAACGGRCDAELPGDSLADALGTYELGTGTSEWTPQAATHGGSRLEQQLVELRGELEDL
jgi:hypothetical protein